MHATEQTPIHCSIYRYVNLQKTVTVAGAEGDIVFCVQLNCTLLSNLETLGIVNTVIFGPARFEVDNEVNPVRATLALELWEQLT